jgi:hypothetical protein
MITPKTQKVPLDTALLVDELIRGLAKKINSRAPDIFDIKNPDERLKKLEALVTDAMFASADTGFVKGLGGK